LFAAPTLIRTDTVGNSAPRKLSNGGANSVGDLIIVDLVRYQAEERIASGLRRFPVLGRVGAVSFRAIREALFSETSSQSNSFSLDNLKLCGLRWQFKERALTTMSLCPNFNRGNVVRLFGDRELGNFHRRAQNPRVDSAICGKHW
jgi:hypothetical protein